MPKLWLTPHPNPPPQGGGRGYSYHCFNSGSPLEGEGWEGSR